MQLCKKLCLVFSFPWEIVHGYSILNWPSHSIHPNRNAELTWRKAGIRSRECTFSPQQRQGRFGGKWAAKPQKWLQCRSALPTGEPKHRWEWCQLQDNARDNAPSQEIMPAIMSPRLHVRKLQLHRRTRGPPESTSVKVELSAPQITALIYVQQSAPGNVFHT